MLDKVSFGGGGGGGGGGLVGVSSPLKKEVANFFKGYLLTKRYTMVQPKLPGT